MVDGEVDRALALLADARVTDHLIRELQDAADEGLSVVASSPFRVRHKGDLRRMVELVDPLDRALRSTRVLVRQTAVAAYHRRPCRTSYSLLSLDLADAADAVADELAADRMAVAARPALLAVGHATRAGRADRRADRRGGARPAPVGRRRPADADRDGPDGVHRRAAPAAAMTGSTADRRWVLHVDLDQFIAAVEVLRRPELAGLPVVVGGRGDPTERGVVATASYEAREFGVGSGMPLRVAARKCPDAVFLPVDHAAYDAASAEVMETLRGLEWGGVPVVVEVLGWDEAFVAAGEGEGVGPPGSAIPASSPRRSGPRVLEATGLHCSVGIGDNKLRAKIATDFGKPRGVAAAHARRPGSR